MADGLIRPTDLNTDTEGRPYEDSGRRQPPTSQGKRPQKKLEIL